MPSPLRFFLLSTILLFAPYACEAEQGGVGAEGMLSVLFVVVLLFIRVLLFSPRDRD